jgi:hypothetical protein
LVFLLLCRDT